MRAVRRELVIKEPVVDPASARWIAEHVLVRAQRNGKPRWAGPNLGDTVGVADIVCECQYGVCGVCKDLGRHDQCSHRLGRARRSDGHETWVVSVRGFALTGVWIRQVLDREWPPCHWVCSCEECERIGPALLDVVTEALPPPRRRFVDGGEQPALF